MIVCPDPENCEPYGEHHAELHGASGRTSSLEYAIQRKHGRRWLNVGNVVSDLDSAQVVRLAWENHNPDESFRVVQREIAPWEPLTTPAST